VKDSSRVLDVAASGVGLLLLAPLFAVVALWVKLDSSGPVFYKARRVGKGGQEFSALKFRSMVVGSDKAGPGITVSGDSRVTMSGRILRRLKIDELPQLINVFVGEMALVGPRPEDPRYVARYREQQLEVLEVRPGITSPASVHYRHEEDVLSGPDWETEYLERVLPKKLTLDHEYLRNRSIISDLGVVARTFGIGGRST